MQYLSAGTEN